MRQGGAVLQARQARRFCHETGCCQHSRQNFFVLAKQLDAESHCWKCADSASSFDGCTKSDGA